MQSGCRKRDLLASLIEDIYSYGKGSYRFWKVLECYEN